MNANIEDNIRYIAIANLIDRNVVIEYAPKREKLSKFQDATNMMIEKLILISITANERHTESMNEEFKFLNVVDRNVRWGFIAITKNTFPERIGYQLLSELENKTLNTLNTKFFNLSNKTDGVVKSHSDNIQLQMVELHRKFKDPGNTDRLISVQRDIDEVQKNMKDNVKQMVRSIDQAELLQERSEKIKLMGKDFRNNAKELMKTTRWGNMKLNIALGGLGASALGGLLWFILK